MRLIHLGIFPFFFTLSDRMNQDDRKRDTYLRLLKEKNDAIKQEERERLDWIEKNRTALEQEAVVLLKEIEQFDPNDIWQYKKGLRLAYLGSLLKNESYREKGIEFYGREWNNPPHF